MSIELTFVGYEGGIPKYMPIDAASQKLCEGQTVLNASAPKKGKRTNKQNNALHLWISQLVYSQSCASSHTESNIVA